MSQQRARRYRIQRFNVIYDTGEEFWSGPATDLSETGIFVETAHQLSLGTEVTIVPDAQGDDALPFEIKAEVTRAQAVNEDDIQNKPGIAFAWKDMSPEQIDQVRAFLQANAND